MLSSERIACLVAVIQMWSLHQVAPIRKNTRLYLHQKETFERNELGESSLRNNAAMLDWTLKYANQTKNYTSRTSRQRHAAQNNHWWSIWSILSPWKINQSRVLPSPSHRVPRITAMLTTPFCTQQYQQMRQLSSRGVLEANNWLVRLAPNLKSDKPEDGATT